MYKQIGIVDLIGAIIESVEEKTGLRCYDAVPENAASPFYFAELVQKEATNSKLMFKDDFHINIHSIASKGVSSVEVFQLVQKLDEALTEDITLPEGFNLVYQKNNGVQAVMTDETQERHAVSNYVFCVSYGFKIK